MIKALRSHPPEDPTRPNNAIRILPSVAPNEPQRYGPLRRIDVALFTGQLLRLFFFQRRLMTFPPASMRERAI